MGELVASLTKTSVQRNTMVVVGIIVGDKQFGLSTKHNIFVGYLSRLIENIIYLKLF